MRSRTAEEIYNAEGVHQAKSAGIQKGAKVLLTGELIEWADLIFVMEENYKEIINAEFAKEVAGKRFLVLDIPDNYYFMEPELVEMIKARVGPYLGIYQP
jgi:predicted protein tyrosine phosphatase